MPDLLEQIYCAQQINIPPNLPFILKQYAKAAIRTQPYDLLYWSAAYFRAKANNSPPPVKERLEYPPVNTPSRLSPGFLKVLHKQLGKNDYVGADILCEKWLGICLVKEALDSMLKVGSMHGKVPWLKFVAIAAGHICPSLKKTMVLVCEVLTEEPEGGSAMIPVEVFVSLYQFLARLDCGPRPPCVPTIDDTVESPSASVTATTQASTYDDTKPETSTKEEGVSENHSSSRLIVSEDMKPTENQDDEQMSKPSEVEGASLEMSVEALDDTQSIIVEADMKEEDSGVTDNSILATVTSKAGDSEKTNADETEELTSPSETQQATEEAPEDLETEENKLEVQKSPDQDNDDVNGEKNDIIRSEGKTSSGGEQNDGSLQETEETQTDTQSMKHNSFQDSVFGPGEKVTVTHVFMDNLSEGTGTLSLSTAQIQKGVFGDKSGFHLQSAHIQNTRNAGTTVTKLGGQEESLTFIDEEKQTEEINKDRSTSDKYSSQSFIVLPSEEMWQHVPGIGPVVPETQILAVLEYMQYWAVKQQGMVMPRNINHLLCPALDSSPPTNQSEDSRSQY